MADNPQYNQQQYSQQAQPAPKSQTILITILGVVILALLIVLVVLYTGKEEAVQQEQPAAPSQPAPEQPTAQANETPLLLVKPVSNKDLDVTKTALVEMFLRDDMDSAGFNITDEGKLADYFITNIKTTVGSKTNMTDQEIEQGLSEILARQAAYSYLGKTDSFKMVSNDLMAFGEKVGSNITLPPKYIETAQSSPLIMTSAAPPENATTGELLERLGIQKNISKEAADYNFIEAIKQEVERSRGKSIQEYLDTVCYLGVLRVLYLDLPFIVHEGNIDASFDIVVYGPDGQIIQELSGQNYGAVKTSGYPYSIFRGKTAVLVPLEYPEGRYIHEFIVSDHIADNRYILRTPLDCERKFVIDQIYFFEDEEAKKASVNLFWNILESGKTYPFSFYSLGFNQDMTRDMGTVIEYYITINALNGAIRVETDEPFTISNITLPRNNILEVTYPFTVDETLIPGMYEFKITAHDMIDNTTASNAVIFEVE